MDYVVTALIIVVVLAVSFGVLIVRHENEPGSRPSLRAARLRVNPRLRRTVAADPLIQPVIQVPPDAPADFPAEP
jgi:hypothetical protein